MGKTFWDNADKYGDSDDLLGKWFAANPEKRKHVFLAIKFGVKPSAQEGIAGIRIDSTPEYCREAIEKSLKRLGLPSIDLYYIHRFDKVTPIEKTIKAMFELKNAGKIKYPGLSECSAESLRRAHAVYPIPCAQIEYSNGFLSGTIRTREDFTKPGDSRSVLSWLSEENLQKNLATVDKIADIAGTKGITMAQLTLAWILAQGDDLFAIPGTTKVHWLAENLGSLFKSLSPEEERSIRQLSQAVVGGRFQAMTGYAFADTPAL